MAGSEPFVAPDVGHTEQDDWSPMTQSMSEPAVSPDDQARPLFELDDWFVRDIPELSMAWEAEQVPAPELVVLAEDLAADLGLDAGRLRSAEGVAVLAGNTKPAGVTPVAMAYAGHQFGGFSPRLGDGRALLLGELVDGNGNRFDLHLKGSGRTPFARGGDGKAVLGPMLREYVFAEAMHALGVPTGRALAVVTTGEPVAREQFLPGAVLARVASSHLRVGTFEYAVRLQDETVLRRLADHAVARHYPELATSDEPHLGLFDAVVDAQAALVAQWMLIGFIHGVMNTDNVAISGETIDYGPCAFMDRYDPATVFSSIDHGGRYAYGNQPSIMQWNLTRLAETLIPLLGDDSDAAVEALTEILNDYPDRFLGHWVDGMHAKLGLDGSAGERELVDDWLAMLHHDLVDYTSSFRALASELRGDRAALDGLFSDTDALDVWLARWHEALGARDRVGVADEMDTVNPLYILRNHLVDEALTAAEAGHTSLFHELLAVVTAPYEERAGLERYSEPASDEFNDRFKTFCGT